MINKETSRLSVFATVLGLILSASNVFALIGENHEQSEIRYGPPVKREGHWLTYIRNNLKIKQHFEEDFVSLGTSLLSLLRVFRYKYLKAATIQLNSSSCSKVARQAVEAV